jgi:hypothetical protein
MQVGSGLSATTVSFRRPIDARRCVARTRFERPSPSVGRVPHTGRLIHVPRRDGRKSARPTPCQIGFYPVSSNARMYPDPRTGLAITVEVADHRLRRPTRQIQREDSLYGNQFPSRPSAVQNATG